MLCHAGILVLFMFESVDSVPRRRAISVSWHRRYDRCHGRICQVKRDPSHRGAKVMKKMSRRMARRLSFQGVAPSSSRYCGSCPWRVTPDNASYEFTRTVNGKGGGQRSVQSSWRRVMNPFSTPRLRQRGPESFPLLTHSTSPASIAHYARMLASNSSFPIPPH